MNETLTTKQRQILHFLEIQYSKLGRSPRLIDLTEHFKVTNKPMLDSLKAIEKKGYISTKGGRVDSIQIIKPLHGEKEYDIFVSYSHEDEDRVQQIVSALEKQGFYVWMDKNQVLVGDNLIEKIYNDGLEKSRFFIIALSKNSTQSNWVKQEMNYIRLQSIKETSAIIRPILLDECTIPAPLGGIFYADFRENFEFGMKSLLKSFDVPREPAPKAMVRMPNQAQDFSLIIKEYREEMQKLEPSIEQKGYKEWLIYPTNDVSIPPRDIVKIANQARIRLLRYGGMPFPYDIPLGFENEHCKAVNRQDGYMQYDCRPGHGGVGDFHYWRMNDAGLFVSRYSLREDELSAEVGHHNYDNTLSWEWLQMDVVRPLLFIKNLLAILPEVLSFRFEFILNKMKGRQLIILNKRRAGFFRPYETMEEIIKLKPVAVITRDTDLHQTAFNIIMNYARIFNWDNPSEGQIWQDIGTFLGGEFPQ